MDALRAIEMLQAALLRDLGDEVDLIFRYGSLLRGAAHAYSDLDVSYVPVHEETWHSITVIVDETMIDCYPIHWSALERMAGMDDVSCTVLLKSAIVYARDEGVAARFRSLPDRLLALQQPAARREMVVKAHRIFAETGYQVYLLRQQAAKGHRLACLYHARAILKSVLHCLMVCNQACIDTRKLDQVLALPRLPDDFAGTVRRVTHATDPGELLAATERLLETTRELLLLEQQAAMQVETTFAEVFDAAYPELKGDLQHLMLACERGDWLNLTLVSLYHELMIHMAQVFRGIQYTGFNSPVEYEQDLAALGFPDLLSYLVAGDLTGLHRQCRAFDERLRQFLTENGAALNAFEDLDALGRHLGV